MDYFPVQQDAIRFAHNHFPQLQPPQHHQNAAYSTRLGNPVVASMTPVERQSVQKKERDLQGRAKAYNERLAAFMSREKGGRTKKNFGHHLGWSVTWEDVLQEIEDSKVDWENKAKGKIIRQEARNLGERARLATHWLNMLPAGDYGSIVCSGLKLLFGAAIAEADYRDLIFDCMDSLPALIEEAGETLDTYQEHVKSDPKHNYRLLNGSLALSAEILTIAEVIVARFELTGWKKGKYKFSALFKQSEHTAKLETCIKNLEKRAKELRRIADQFQRKVTMETGDRVKDLATKEDLSQASQFLMEGIKNASWRNATQLLAASTWQNRPITPVQVTYLTQEQIFEFLRIDPIPIVEAMHKGLDSAYHDTRDFSTILRPLQQDISFLNWLRSNQSGIIILDHNSDVSTAPFSYFAATLVESLKHFHQAIAIHYFCPVWDPDNPEPGTYHMLRSLIFQLLPYMTNHGILPEDVYSDVEMGQRLWNLFRQCLDLIPAGTTIFVTIDGISRHTVDDEAEALFVTRLLMAELPRYQYVNKRIKVLLTAPTTSEIAEMVGYESIVMIHPEEEGRGDSDEDVDVDFGELMDGDAEG